MPEVVNPEGVRVGCGGVQPAVLEAVKRGRVRCRTTQPPLDTRRSNCRNRQKERLLQEFEERRVSVRAG
jgi:hypothetical protein